MATIGRARVAFEPTLVHPPTPSTASSAARLQELRIRARHLMLAIDAALETYSAAVATANETSGGVSTNGTGGATANGKGAGCGGDGDRVPLIDVRRRVNELRQVVDGMRGLSLPAAAALVPSYTSRLREFEAELERHERVELMATPKREDADSTAASGMLMGYREEEGVEMSVFGSVQHSTALADEFVDQGLAVHEMLGVQNNTARGDSMVVNNLRHSLPQMDGMIEKAQARKRRNKVILSLFVAFMLCALILYYLQFS
eukprot:TRINITY_DN7498_c0_g1_i1.p1 TRINITY_DN7498_c0_g1~~TRINITY_DN7498_c0_g1_i1.p1  ORF type:complete len:260 (+),score=61.72 TRINITY_DN7498_c0_g1_i1:595-1374(+)